MNIFQKILLVWEKVSMTHRVLLIAVILTAVTGGALLLHWARRPDMQILFSDLDPQEASKIVEYISSKDITYQLKAGESRIDVPREHIHKLRLDIAGKGLLSSQKSGYSLFDNEKIGISPMVQRINSLRAQQTEIAKTIQWLDGIQNARVHIVNSERDLFKSKQSNVKASVTLNIRPGHKLTPNSIAAITNLVASSVKDLTPDNVTIVDTQGRLLSSKVSDQLFTAKASTRQDYKERVERSLEQKAEEMLSLILGPERAMVKVSAVIDTNNLRIRSEIQTPGKALKEETTKKNEPVLGGNSDTQTEIPSKTETIEKIDYAKNITIKEQTAIPGEIISLSVSVIVDLRPPDVNQANAAQAAQAAPVMQVADVENLIKNALGLKATDQIVVQNLPIYHAPDAQQEVQNNWAQYMKIAEHSSMGIMSVCALLVLMIFKKAKKKANTALMDQAQLAAGTEGDTNQMALGQAAMQKQIATALKNNPQQVKELFATWIQEG